MFRHAFLLYSLFAVLCAPLAAQVPLWRYENKWEVSFLVGLSALGDQSFPTPIEGGGSRNVGLDFDSSYVLGARITENLGEHFGAELEYALGNHPGTFLNLSSAVSRLEFDQKIHKIVYSALFYPFRRDRAVRPFGSIGAGTSFYQISTPQEPVSDLDLTDRWKFAFSYGGGVKLQLGRQWGVRVDIRDHVTGVPDFGLPSRAPLLDDDQIGPGFLPDGRFHNWQISAGLMYTFGRR